MAGVTIDLQLSGNLSRALADAQRAGEDLSTPFAEIAGDVLLHTRERFDREISPAGVPWKQSRRAAETGGKTLLEHGFLKAAIRERHGRDYAEIGVEQTAGPARYAAIHQFGGRITPRKGRALSFAGRAVAAVTMPARPYLGIEERDRRSITQILGAHLYRALGTVPA